MNINKCHRTLSETLTRGECGPSDYHEEMRQLDLKYRVFLLEDRILRREWRVIVQDMETECRSWWPEHSNQSRASLAKSENQTGAESYSSREERISKEPIMVSEAYANAVRHDLINEETDFDKAVMEYHAAIRPKESHIDSEAHCSLTGWLPESDVRVAHLMPIDHAWNKKYARLFAPLLGVDDLSFRNRRNGAIHRSSNILVSELLGGLVDCCLSIQEFHYITASPWAWKGAS